MGRNGAPLSGRTAVPPVSTPVCLSAGPRCLAASPLPGVVRHQSPLSAVLPLSPASVLPLSPAGPPASSAASWTSGRGRRRRCPPP
eukprot:scaffold49768_cov55-Phaeocystis_antarctica.AAC.3